MKSVMLAVMAILVSACSTGPAVQPSGGVQTSAIASPTAAPTGAPASGLAVPPATSAPSSGSKPPPNSPSASLGASPSTKVAPATGAPSNSPTAPSPSFAEPSAGVAATRWHRIEAENGPSAREDHTWTVDGDGRFAYLFGGRDGTRIFNDLWRFDLVNGTWERLDVANAPAPRFGHTATLVPDYGLVIFGGQAGGDFFNDLWAYDGGASSWNELPAGGAVPEPRYGTCAGLAPDGRLWISHGFTDQGRFFDQRAYNFASGAWADITREDPVPVIRCLHDCFWTPDGRFILYGGQTNGVAALGDLWVRPADAGWQAQPDPPLVARQLYAVAVVGSTAWIFGGGDIDRMPLRDLWTLDLGPLTWQEVEAGGSIPSARLSATLIADPVRSRLLLFGGKSGTTAFDDLWEFRLPA